MLFRSEAVLAGRRAKGAAEAQPDPLWVYGPDGASLASQLAGLGLIDDPGLPGPVA